MNKGWFNIPWFVCGILCALVAIIYFIIPLAPYKNFTWTGLPAWNYFVLRWLHSIVWILLLIACIYMQVKDKKGGKEAKLIALGGLSCYVIYITVYILSKKG